MRILVEGVDLSGKTTLVNNLVLRAERARVPALVTRGYLAERNPVNLLLKVISATRHPRSRLLNLAYIVGGLLDRAHEPDCEGIVIHEGYVDRSITYAAAQDWWIGGAALGIRKFLPTFDVAIYVTATRQTRLQRAALRHELNTVDQVTLSPAFSDTTYENALNTLSERHGSVLKVATDWVDPEEIADEVWDFIDGLLPGPGR